MPSYRPEQQLVLVQAGADELVFRGPVFHDQVHVLEVVEDVLRELVEGLSDEAFELGSC